LCTTGSTCSSPNLSDPPSQAQPGVGVSALAADAASTICGLGPLRMQSLVRSRRSQLTPRARFVVSALSECWGSCPIPTLAACAASTICRVARLRMRAFVDARHSKSARLRRAPGCGEWGAPPPPHLCLSRQAPLLSPRPARSASEGRPRGLSLLASFVMRTERNDVGAIRFAGSAQSVVGRIRRQRLRRCTGLGVRPRPASRSLPVFCCGPRYAAIWRARGSRHLTTSRDPRDEALATSRPPAVGQRPPRVSDDRCDWEADDSASYGSALRPRNANTGLPRGVSWGEGASRARWSMRAAGRRQHTVRACLV
jgi:hypothetical protein